MVQMKFVEHVKELDSEVFSDFPGELGIFASHYENKVVVQIRYNGEMDSTYELKSKGLGNQEQEMALDFGNEGGEFADDYAPVRDPLSHYDVITKLGDSNDMKIPIICTQIAQLYDRVIIPRLGGQQGLPSDYVITLSTKLWRKSEVKSFEKLIFLLAAIKEAYE